MDENIVVGQEQWLAHTSHTRILKKGITEKITSCDLNAERITIQPSKEVTHVCLPDGSCHSFIFHPEGKVSFDKSWDLKYHSSSDEITLSN